MFISFRGEVVARVSIARDSSQSPNSNNTTKRIWLPSDMFEFIKEIPGTESAEYKCLLGCTPEHRADGSIKYVSVNNTSRYNARRHIKVNMFKYFTTS